MTIHSRLPDYYSLLGVSKHASSDEIRRAFWRRAKLFHPDLNRSSEAKEAFLVLSEAYYVLRDEERRETFDISLEDDEVDAWSDDEAVGASGDDETFDVFGEDEDFDALHTYDRFRVVETYGPATEEIRVAPRTHALVRRTPVWGPGIVLASLMSASALLLVIPTSPRYPNTSTQTASIASQAADATASQTPAAQPPLVAASDASDTSEAHHPEPLVVKEDAAPTPDRDSWEATASPAQMRPVTAPDVLDEVPVAQAKPVRAAAAVPTPAAGPAPKLAANPVASPVAKVALTPVAKAAPKLAGRSVATALVRRARVITARQVRHARAYAAARAAKLWTTKKRQYGWRHSTRRRYASY